MGDQPLVRHQVHGCSGESSLRPIDLDEAIGVADALRAYTIDAAYAGFEEGTKGSLEVGKLADLVVLAEDPFTIPASNLDEVGTDLVIIGGAVASAATR